jgi:cyclohexanecarboxylate-CoA ligase
VEFDSTIPEFRHRELVNSGAWRNTLVCDALDDAARARPDHPAVVDCNISTGRPTTLSYRELQRLSIRVAAGLAAMGIEKNDVVAIQLPNWWHYAVLHTACVRIGAVVNPLMPIFRHHELEFMLSYAEAKVLVVPRDFRNFEYQGMVAELRPELPHLEHVLVVDGEDERSNFDARLIEPDWERRSDVEQLFAARRPSPDAVVELMYTSGTTGQPKGVMHTSNTLGCKALLATELFGLGPDDVMFMGSPLAHQTGFMYACVLPIYAQTTAVLQDIWDPELAAKNIADHRASITLGSTPFLSDLVKLPQPHSHDMSSLRLFLCAGAPIPRVLLHDAKRSHPNLYVMSAWGMTENGVVTATYPGDPEEKVFETDGRALPHQAVRVVDDDGNPVPVGVEGHLEARCASNFVGYLKRPEAYGMTDDMWFDTGDNARMDSDGYIRITGRTKDIIIRGGENIPVVEIEELLYRHPSVVDVAVVAMNDERLGERGCAYVALQPGSSLSFREMVDYLWGNQLTKQYTPERLEIIDSFPRTSSGKIQKFKLRELAADLTPQSLTDD